MSLTWICDDSKDKDVENKTRNRRRNVLVGY